MSATGSDFITIVSGLPRSGTSMMMQMLQAGGMPILTDQLRRPDEDNPRGYYEFERVKKVRTDTSWLESACGKAVKAVYRLLYDLPKNHCYRVVFMKRKLAEVLASQQQMLQRQGKTESPVPDSRLAELFTRELQAIERWLRDQENFAVLYVNYEDALSNPRAVTMEVSRFLGPRLDPDAMAAAVDPALYRQKH